MRAHDFKKSVLSVDRSFARRARLQTLQVNLGNVCNQKCAHCHANASPAGDKLMSRRIMDDIAYFLKQSQGLTLDITGGCPELNPNFRYLIEKAGPHAGKIMVRSNLTVFFEPGMEDLAGFYARNKIKLVGSMPCYTKENVDKQRGEGVFDKSIRALKILNGFGYGSQEELVLDLVYNPGGAFLPGDQAELERDYKKVLSETYGVVFNRLITITNAPINRFAEYLKASGDFDAYMKLLIDNFNRDVVGNIMCRTLLSIGWDGILYDCDFNQALGLAMRDASGKIMEMASLRSADLEEKEILLQDHCYCCTAGAGSSCGGALKK
jgi:radical SAM/Cys-rich protein